MLALVLLADVVCVVRSSSFNLLIWGSVADFVNLMEVGQTRSRYAHHGAPARLWWCK